MSLDKRIGEIHAEFLVDLKETRNSRELELVKVKYLGKKGPVAELMVFLQKATKEERPLFGKLINDIKLDLAAHLEASAARLLQGEIEEQVLREAIDFTLPGRKKFAGRFHPITLMMQRMLSILESMGFSVQYAPDVESDFYNFEALNFSKDHPAREMQDTFYINSEYLLRTHTSNAQVRAMESCELPLRIASPGRCFRNETVSSRSHVFFHQIELFYIDKNVAFADLMAMLGEFWTKFFEKKIETRFRPSYFPFVEPGMECDITCAICGGTGCKLCKHTGYLEVCGAGMIHPEVLKAGGIDSEEYSGYAVGMGGERLAMLYYGIEDIRLFTENDMRFLEQFNSY